MVGFIKNECDGLQTGCSLNFVMNMSNRVGNLYYVHCQPLNSSFSANGSTVCMINGSVVGFKWLCYIYAFTFCVPFKFILQREKDFEICNLTALKTWHLSFHFIFHCRLQFLPIYPCVTHTYLYGYMDIMHFSIKLLLYTKIRQVVKFEVESWHKHAHIQCWI